MDQPRLGDGPCRRRRRTDRRQYHGFRHPRQCRISPSRRCGLCRWPCRSYGDTTRRTDRQPLTRKRHSGEDLQFGLDLSVQSDDVYGAASHRKEGYEDPRGLHPCAGASASCRLAAIPAGRNAFDERRADGGSGEEGDSPFAWWRERRIRIALYCPMKEGASNPLISVTFSRENWLPVSQSPKRYLT